MVGPRRTRLLPLSSSSSFFFFFVFVVVLFSLFESAFQQQNSSAPLSSGVELLALFGLRSSLGLRARDWPIKADPCRSWNGVRCENGRVVGITVAGLRRTRVGRLSPRFEVNAMGNLTLLKTFNASGFALPGSIPDWFGRRLGSLEVLDLRSCSVVGSIPSGLGNLTNLTGLYLSRNSLSGSIPFSLGSLARLSALDLSHNSLSGSIPSSIANLRNASLLDLSSNSLLGRIPPGIGTLSGLRTLNLSNNNLSSQIPAQLGDLGALVDLDLGGNSLSGLIPPELRGLRNLKRMLLGDNFLGGPLTNELFVVQTQLEVLVLNQNSFAGDFPVRVWTIPGLTFLDISGNNFTGQLPNSSSNGNNTNSVLNISGNLFYGGLTPAVISFVSVDLSGNYFQGMVPSYVTLNTSLVQNCLQNLPNQRTMSDCEAFYSARGLDFNDFGVPTPSRQPPRTAAKNSSRKRRKLAIILGAVLGGAGLILVIVITFVLCMCFGAKRASSSNTRGVASGVGPVPPSSSPPTGVTVFSLSIGDAFTYQQILQATGDFGDANLLKKGRSGDLYRGILESGVPVVVKRVDLRSVKKEGHAVELDFFARVSHSRFVPFLGHCLENEDEKYMVYKYMPNGDLSSSLFKKSKTEEDGLQSLDWITRLKIALGAAEGLSYLHHECNPPLVHRDVQASSILLDDKFEVRLGSLSEVCAQEGDPHQSKITRLLRLPQSSDQGSSGTSTASCAYDVYCFGKVLLELVTGKLGISSSSEAQTKEWLDQTLPYINIYEKELMTRILDPSLIVDEDLMEEVWAMAVVARSCLNPKPSRRPPMRYILKALENPLKVVREENSGGGGGSARLRTTSSRGSWNAALFGSWRSSSDVTVILPGSNSAAAAAAAAAKAESGLKRSGTSGSQASGGGVAGHNGGGGEHSSSHRRNSREIFPEPSSD